MNTHSKKGAKNMKNTLKVIRQGTLKNGYDYIVIQRTYFRGVAIVEYIAYVDMVNATFKDLDDAKAFVENYRA